MEIVDETVVTLRREIAQFAIRRRPAGTRIVTARARTSLVDRERYLPFGFLILAKTARKKKPTDNAPPPPLAEIARGATGADGGVAGEKERKTRRSRRADSGRTRHRGGGGGGYAGRTGGYFPGESGSHLTFTRRARPHTHTHASRCSR